MKAVEDPGSIVTSGDLGRSVSMGAANMTDSVATRVRRRRRWTSHARHRGSNETAEQRATFATSLELR